MASYELVQCNPVPSQFAPILRTLLAESGATLQSAYRGRDVEDLLHKCGKHSQAELYDCFRRGVRGCNPANPPGRSTHELFNDGVAYTGPAGARLPWWCVGLDIDDADVQNFIRAAARHGYLVTVTYPGSRSEYHHVNFRRAPKPILKPLKRGMQGPRVWLLKKRLRRLKYLSAKGLKTKGFGGQVQDAVKAFQRRHKLVADGIVGPATQTAIEVALRRSKRK